MTYSEREPEFTLAKIGRLLHSYLTNKYGRRFFGSQYRMVDGIGEELIR